MRKSKHFRKAALIGMSIAFLLSTFFSENSSDINSYIKNYGGFNFPQTVPSASRVVKSTNERRVYDSRPEFVYEHPYISSSYYTSTSNFKTLYATDMLQVQPKLLASKQKMRNEGDIKTRLAIVRPFCEFDAEALPSTFTCWNALPPCKAALDDIGDEYGNEYESGPDGEFMAFRNNTAVRNLFQSFPENHYFDQVGSDAMKTATADVFLFYSQTYSENQVAIKAVDTIIEQFFEPGGWSQCFDNIYAIEANIPQELDLYIPSAQEELYNWVNGPNRQFEAAFRIIQSGEWGDYDGFYLMEGDSVPIKAHWLDVVLSEIEVNRPFAILGAQYDGDKWDNFYEKIPISLLHHTNGNAIYNTSHPLLERLVGQLEVEAPCPYNSIPYDYRMSQMWVEGTLGIVPKLAPKIMLNEEGENITLSNNTHMFTKWAETWEEEDPFKYTPVIHNYAATNLIPRHLGPEYIIHGAKLYSPWDPTKTEVTLVVSEWFFDRSLHLIQHLDDKDHPFSEVVVMVPPAAAAHDDYDLMTEVPVRTQHRGAPDYMDLCEAEVNTDWFMITNSYHHVARHVDLMFTPGTFKPVIPFTPATYAFCFKYPYCKETVSLAQRFNPGHDKVVQDMDMLYNTKLRNAFCKEWKKQNGDEGEDMYKDHQRRLMFRKKIIGPPGPTGTSYYAWLVHEGKDGMYKLTDRSLYGARPPFVKIFAKEEKLDGMSEDELAKRVGMTLVDNSTDCNCMEFQTESDCEDSGIGCIWRPLFETCHPPELIDGGAPICATTEAPTSAPTVSLEGLFDETGSPTLAPTPPDPEQEAWYFAVFKSREHEALRPTDESDSLNSLSTFDDDAIPDPERVRKLKNRNEVSYPVQLNYSRRKASENSNSHGGLQFIHDIKDEVKSANDVENNGLEIPLPRKLSAEFTDSEYEIGIFEDPLLTRDEIVVGSSRNDKDEFGLPMQRCDTWGPSVVHRNPIQESKQNRTKILHEIQLVSAHEESRPRRLLSSKFSPINVDKYAVGSTPSETNRNVGLATPQSNNAGQLPSTHRTILNYGDKHPFEGALYEPGVTYKPLRIHFDTEQLTSYSFESEADEINFNAQIVAIVDVILPSIRDIWAEALSVVPVIGNFFLTGVNGGKCGDADIPKSYSTSGLPDTDMLIFVTKNGQFCQDGTPSYASLCSFDQHMRPIAGNLVVCLKDIKVRNGIVPDEESLRQISLHTLEVGKMLGLSPTLFQHYRNPATGRPWGTSARTVTCVDGVVDTFDVPNILDQSFYTGDEFSDDSADGAYFEVISPTVKQVVRNHFDCQTLRGARLENKATSFSCFGETFDGRFHFDDDLTSTSPTADKAFTISPLSLALLQDSSWYKADFSKATVPVFGRGGGCGFVNGPCIVDGSVQGHSIGFFCDLNILSGCDFTHLHKAVCDIGQDTSLSQDHCPMRTKNIVVCSDEGNKPDFSFESFGPNSRCFETAQSKAACIPSFCNKADARIDLIVDDDVYQCDYEGQLIKIHEEYVKCPRLAVVCPDIVCPANCSGNGMCDYCQEVPQCICDDPFDESPGCYGDSAV